MIRHRQKPERAKVSARWKIMLILALLLIASFMYVSPDAKELQTYEVKLETQDADFRLLLKSHDTNLSATKAEMIREKDQDYLSIMIGKGGIDEAIFRTVNLSSGLELGIDTGLESLSMEGYDTAKAFAIDPEKIDFQNATFTIQAKGKQLFKCKEYDFEGQRCFRN